MKGERAGLLVELSEDLGTHQTFSRIEDIRSVKTFFTKEEAVQFATTTQGRWVVRPVQDFVGLFWWMAVSLLEEV